MFLKAGDIYWPVVFTNAKTVALMQLPSIHKQCLPQDNVVILCTLFLSFSKCQNIFKYHYLFYFILFIVLKHFEFKLDFFLNKLKL